MTTNTNSASLGADGLADLEEERRFLLRSLRDLDRELEAGDVERGDYQTLRDDYTARAAAVLRAIEDRHGAVVVERPRSSVGSRLLVAVAVLAIAAGVGLLVARSAGQRLPGQEISGGQSAGADDIAAVLVGARNALGSADYQTSAELYASVLQRDPDHPEALAYSGWLTVLVSRGASDDVATDGLDGGKERLRQAIEADQDYADPHCFLAIVAEQYEDDTATARREGEQCLDLNPPAQMRGLVEEFVASLDGT
ncbi:MAG: hypothetical protein M3337_08180 [Actinomycetota bacterium]|nr:hypothetical protein [Actinomycetota bacterium]